MFDLAVNPFLWQAFVLSVFSFVVGLAVHTVGSMPRRILDAI